MKAIVVVLSLLGVFIGMAQNTVEGKVIDSKGVAVEGANIYLEGTYDGSSSNKEGYFSFTTEEVHQQTLVVSMLSYQSNYLPIDVSKAKDLIIILQEDVQLLDGVTLSAGTFKAGDNSKASVLKPLDIVTTAGAAGDVVAALQTLPGTTTVNEDGRLFVRGGSAEETKVFIDGLQVFQPFGASVNNVPARGRFSPFLFKGITFSTGGYSAEYGQALSSVLLLNTTDMPEQDKTDISIMSVGAGVGHTKIWGEQSVSVNASYMNLAPYQGLLSPNNGIDWKKPFESFSGEGVYRNKKEKSLFKLYLGGSYATVAVNQEDINYEEKIPYSNKNGNMYGNASYKYYFNNGYTLFAGASLAGDDNTTQVLDNRMNTKENASHLKVTLKKRFSNRIQMHGGAEYTFKEYSYLENNQADVTFTDNTTALFLESDFFLNEKLALQFGIRTEESSLLQSNTISPRVAIAYKNANHSQFSFAYGQFYQTPQNDYIKYSNTLDQEKATHYILNYQYLDDGKTFRAEAYYKGYKSLVKYDTDFLNSNTNFNNDGKGYASGLDLFWRDNKGIKNLDYWLSYSFLDTERDYQNFSEQATPSFAPKHSFSAVAKYWVEGIRSQVGLSYSYGSGRTYFNPNNDDFMKDITKPYHNLSANLAYLISPQKILYLSISNVPGFKNVNGYQYASSPNNQGVYNRRAILPANDRFYFVGFFWTISSDKKSNQLQNL